MAEVRTEGEARVSGDAGWVDSGARRAEGAPSDAVAAGRAGAADRFHPAAPGGQVTGGARGAEGPQGAPSGGAALKDAGDRSHPAQSGGRRDAEASKAAIVRAARHLLARHAHGDITLKAVADRAGVSAPLVLKYFGNKDALFSQVMSFEADADTFLDAPVDDLGRHMVLHLLTVQAERGADPILRIVFAPLHGEQGDILRANFRVQVAQRLSERLAGPDAGLRAELAVGMLLGLGVMYGIARGPHLRATEIAEITDRYAPAVQALLTPH